MRALGLAIVLLLVGAAAADATQLSYIDQGQIWVSTLDGQTKRAISGPAPVVTAGENRAWTEQAQSDDGYIIGVTRESGKTGAAAPTRLWNPSGAVAAQSTLGYHGAYNNGSLAVPVTLDLTPGGGQLLYSYSDLVYGYPTSTLYRGTWVQNTSNSSGEPFDIPNLVGSSLAGSRWVGINANAASTDPNVFVEAPGGQGPFSTSGNAWFPVTGASGVDVAANGSVAGVIFKAGDQPYVLGLFAASGLDATLPGASCDLPSVGNVNAVSISQDGSTVAWTDDRGLLVAPMPPLGSGSPCPLAAPPTVISSTGSSPTLGPTTLASAPVADPAPSGSPGTTVGPAPTGTTPPPSGGSTTRPSVSLAKTVRATTLATGLAVSVTVKAKGAITITAKVGRTTLARRTAKAANAGRVKVVLKASKRISRGLKRYRGKTLVLSIKAPGGSVTVKRKLR